MGSERKVRARDLCMCMGWYWCMNNSLEGAGYWYGSPVSVKLGLLVAWITSR